MSAIEQSFLPLYDLPFFVYYDPLDDLRPPSSKKSSHAPHHPDHHPPPQHHIPPPQNASTLPPPTSRPLSLLNMSSTLEQPPSVVAAAQEIPTATASTSSRASDASSSRSTHPYAGGRSKRPSPRDRVRRMQDEHDRDIEMVKQWSKNKPIINTAVFDKQPTAILDPNGVPYALGVAALEAQYTAIKTEKKQLPNPHEHRRQCERERRRARRREPPAKPTPQLTALGKYRRAYECYDDEYREEILEIMYKCMHDTLPNRAAMEQQPQISLSMRQSLIEFITDLHSAYYLRPETLFLAINVLDRYASKRVIYRRHYQLVGCAALLVAAKYEDAKENQPLTPDLKRYCSHIYALPAFNQMERHILHTLDFRMGHPTCEAWFRAFTTGIDRSFSESMKKEIERNGWGHIEEIKRRGIPMECFDQNANAIARCFMEIMQVPIPLIGILPSAIAEAAVILTKAIYYSRRDRGVETPAGLQVARFMDEHLARHLAAVTDNVAQKYGPDTPEDGFRRIARWFLGTRIPTHGKFVFLDTIVDHDPKLPNSHTPITDDLLEFQRRQLEAYKLKEEEEERVRMEAKLQLEREEAQRAAAEEAERQRRADDSAAQFEICRAKREAQIRARAQAEHDPRLTEEPTHLRPSESFDSGYGSVGEAMEAEDKESIAVRRTYACYDESDSEAEAAEVKSEILSSGRSSPEPEDATQ